MRILWINLRNFKCFKTLQLPEEGIFPEGLIFVEGNNSTGKSSLFDAIFYAFFYDAAKSKEIGIKDDLIHYGRSETDVEVAFEINNRYYLIQREHGKKKSVNAKLSELDEKEALQGLSENPIRLVAEGVVDVEAKINSLFNINRTSALNTLIVRQGQIQQLAEAKGAELRDIIYELFSLDYYKDRVNIVVKKHVNTLEDDLEDYSVKRTTEDITEEIQYLNTKIADIKENTKILEGKVVELDEEIKQYPDLKEIQDIQKIVDNIDTQNVRTSSKLGIVETIAGKYGIELPISEKKVNQKLVKINTESEKLEEETTNFQKKQKKLLEEVAERKKELDILEKRKESLERFSSTEEMAKCDVCEQEINNERRDDLISRASRDIPTLIESIQQREKKNEDLYSDIDSIKQKTRTLISIKVEIARLETIYQDYEKSLKDINTLSTELTTKVKKFGVSEVKDLAKKYNLEKFDDLYSKIVELDREKSNVETNKERNIREIKEKNQQILKLNNQIESNKEKEKESERIRNEISLLKSVEKHVEGFIVEDIISNRLLAGIQDSTSDYIYNFTRGQYSQLYLEATKVKTLNMSIKDETDGFIKSQNLLSGGDRAAIGLGMRIGLCDLLKRIKPLKSSPYNPPQMDILILDEPLGSLDEHRRSKVVEGLVAEKKFTQIFLITHTNIRRDLRTPTITVEKTSAGSKINFYESPTEIEVEAEE